MGFIQCCKSFKNTDKMNKLIIDNRTKLKNLKGVTLVGRVIEQGRIRNEGKE